MIKKLRKKFILINMVFVTTILLAVVGSLIYGNSKKYRRESSDLLHRIIAMGQEDRDSSFRRPIGPDPGSKHKWNPPMRMIPFFKVSLGEDGSVDQIVQRDVSIEDSVIEELAASALRSARSEGSIPGYSLRYLKEENGEGWSVAFVDSSYEETAMRTLLINCVLLFLGAEIAFLGLSLYLSKWALNPVEQAWEQQNQFVADASHELKTPITIILANLGILLAHKDSSIGSQEKWLCNTRTEAERMKILVEDLLFLARADSGAGVSAQMFSEMDLSDALWSTLLPFESMAFENKVTLESAIAPGLQILGNERQIKQLAAILLDNACKYAGAGGRVEVTAGLDPEKRVFIRVANTGEMIQKEDLEHVFERFYRADKSRVRTAGGYGLGLPIAKTIAETHGGQIHVASSEKDGTVFTVVFASN